MQAVRQTMDADSIKEIGDVNPVSSCRRNILGISKSSWSRISKSLHYHPYKPMRCQDLRPADLPKRRAFCTWILGRNDNDLNSILFSDELILNCVEKLTARTLDCMPC